MRYVLRLLTLLLSTLLPPLSPASAIANSCGGPDAACAVALGDHNIVLPKKANKAPVPVAVHFHGARGSGATVTRNRKMMKPFLDRDCTVIPSNSLGRESHKGGCWSFIPGRSKLRNALTFTH